MKATQAVLSYFGKRVLLAMILLLLVGCAEQFSKYKTSDTTRNQITSKTRHERQTEWRAISQAQRNELLLTWFRRHLGTVYDGPGDAYECFGFINDGINYMSGGLKRLPPPDLDTCSLKQYGNYSTKKYRLRQVVSKQPTTEIHPGMIIQFKYTVQATEWYAGYIGPHTACIDSVDLSHDGGIWVIDANYGLPHNNVQRHQYQWEFLMHPENCWTVYEVIE